MPPEHEGTGRNTRKRKSEGMGVTNKERTRAKRRSVVMKEPPIYIPIPS